MKNFTKIIAVTAAILLMSACSESGYTPERHSTGHFLCPDTLTVLTIQDKTLQDVDTATQMDGSVQACLGCKKISGTLIISSSSQDFTGFTASAPLASVNYNTIIVEKFQMLSMPNGKTFVLNFTITIDVYTPEDLYFYSYMSGADHNNFACDTQPATITL